MSVLAPSHWLPELTTRWAGRGLVDYQDSLPSTNTRLRELARQGAPHGSLCLCRTQTAGRGRLQRNWIADPGDALTFSLLLRPRLAPDQLPLCTFAAAVALCRAVQPLCPGLSLGVKWPNDFIAGGKKCAGILSELVTAPDGAPAVVAGVGVNVGQRAFPEEIRPTATSLALAMEQAGISSLPPALHRVLTAFLREIEPAMELLEDAPAAFMAQYRSVCVTLGSPVRVIGREDSFIGVAEDLDETGALLVRQEDGTLRRVLSGDVSVRGLMGYV